MKITEQINLFYPDVEKEKYAINRRIKLSSYPNTYIENLEVKRISLMLLPHCPDKVLQLFLEMNDDIETLNYRLDCLEDFIHQPKLSDTFRKIIRKLSDNNKTLSLGNTAPNSFMELKTRMDELQVFIDCIGEINAFYSRYKNTIKSKAMTKLFEFFGSLNSDENFLTVINNLSELQQIFSKTIRSVKIGINFTSDMTPDVCGILEVSNQKIYPKGNVLDRLIFKTYSGFEQFSGEEHINSQTRNQSPDMDTALFKELDRYTRDFTKRISQALKNYRELFFTDISELENQLDFYDGAVNLISYVKLRGLEMSRPVILEKSKRILNLTSTFDLCFFRQASTADYNKFGDDLIISNDISMDTERFFIITGVNNGGKTTFARGIGICQLLAQIGMYVPAQKAEISPVDFIFTHFPKEEEIGIDSSRFTTEIKQLKEICDLITPYSMVILNESIQSTTPEECLEIATRHLEIMAVAGVRGMYVTHLNGLYQKSLKINQNNYASKIGSLVSVADENTGKRLYKIKSCPPLTESMAYTVYDNFGAKIEDVAKRLGVNK
ncbi:MAG: hypothetical protein IJ031_02225 [Oscillospiraceae bacterium]|nr:hypothetical protein [Oscillospiraceae bacterium]